MSWKGFYTLGIRYYKSQVLFISVSHFKVNKLATFGWNHFISYKIVIKAFRKRIMHATCYGT